MQSAAQKAEALAAWDRFRFGGLFQLVFTAMLGIGPLLTPVKVSCSDWLHRFELVFTLTARRICHKRLARLSSVAILLLCAAPSPQGDCEKQVMFW
jgi:hypothetical protein